MNITDIHFLVIEDEEFQRVLVVHMLAGLGAKHVIEAPDGRAALEIWKRRAYPVNIVISDLDMPGMDGMEFIRRIAEADSSVSLILMSIHEQSLLDSVATMAEAYGIKVLGT